MTKCDFCVYSDPKHGCYWGPLSRIVHCEEAIQKMTKALMGTVKMDGKGE